MTKEGLGLSAQAERMGDAEPVNVLLRSEGSPAAFVLPGVHSRLSYPWTASVP